MAARLPVVRPFETHAGQYVPESSRPEAAVFPALFEPVGGEIATGSIAGPNLGYRIEDIDRPTFRSP